MKTTSLIVVAHKVIRAREKIVDILINGNCILYMEATKMSYGMKLKLKSGGWNHGNR